MLNYRLRLALRSLVNNFDKLAISLFNNLTMNALVYLINGLHHLKSIRFSDSKTLPLLSGVNLHAINSLFWLYSADEIKNNGVRGISQTLSAGNYPLSNFWYYSPLSLFWFRRMGVGMSFLCISLVPISFFFMGQKELVILVGAVILYLSFPAVHAMAYALGRYHSPAWLALPWFLMFFMDGHYYWAAAAFAAIAITSSTVLTVTFCLAIAAILWEQEIIMVWSLLPGLILGAGYPLYLMSGKGIETPLKKIWSVFKAIGTTRGHQAKYARKEQSKFNYKSGWYFYSAIFYLLVAYFTFDSVPYLFITATALFCINVLLFRFADWQTVQYLMVIAALVDLLLSANSPLALAAPIFFTSYAVMHNIGATKIDEPAVKLRPTDFNNEASRLCQFVGAVPGGSRILILFRDPQGEYEKLFDGYRHCIEGIIYAGVQKGVCVLPNFYAVFQYNHPDDPGFWAADQTQMRNAAKQWKCDYVLVNRREFESEEAFCNVSDEIARFSYDVSGFDNWSAKHFKNPDWSLLKV